MKTITEFTATSLQAALKTKQELLGAGKTAEELPAAMGEALKLEGEKLNLLISALEVIEKKPRDLKRVVVWSLQEGETPPRGTEQKGEHHFGIEYFPPMPGQERGKHAKGRGDRDRKGGRKGRDKGGRGPRRDGRTSGRDSGRATFPGVITPRAGGAAEGTTPAGEGQGEQDKRRRPRRWKPSPKQPGPGGVITPKKTGVITPRVAKEVSPASAEASGDAGSGKEGS